jgi:hypothetical protein
MSAEMAMMVETMRQQMLQSQAQMAQTQQMLQLMMQQRQDDDRRYQDERTRERSERARLEEATLAAAAAATNIAETMSSVSETVLHADAEDKVEVVKSTAALPKLESAAVAEPAIRCGDWLVRATMIIGSYSETASVWWQHVRERAQEAYDEWLAKDPMDRAAVQVQELAWHRYSQLSIRVATALLDAIPDEFQRELISTRQIDAVTILFRLLVVYQPGGQEERQKILSELRKAKAASTAKMAVEELRTWFRRMNRAKELKLSLPDPSEQWHSITTICDGLVATNHALQWRVMNARTTLRVDTSH